MGSINGSNYKKLHCVVCVRLQRQASNNNCFCTNTDTSDIPKCIYNANNTLCLKLDVSRTNPPALFMIGGGVADDDRLNFFFLRPNSHDSRVAPTSK